jgi:hypothetical protein
MMKRFFVSALLLFFAGLSISAQDVKDAPAFSLTGNLTAIYTLGNAGEDQKLATGRGDGAYEELKNGYFVESNLYTWFRPVSFLEGYFKLYAISRPGSFYVPLSVEPKSNQTFSLSLDKMYGRISVLEALGFDLPVNLYFKTGKYKAEPNHYQSISRFGMEKIAYMLVTANTYNYEAEVAAKPLGDDFIVSGSFVGNYRFDEGIPRLYDNDGGVSPHGMPVLGEYAPQFMAFLRFSNLNVGGSPLSGEIIYGQNVSDIYSGNSFGADFLYNLSIIPNTLTVPIGLGIAYFEKNIDLLGRAASIDRGKESIDFRDNFSGTLSAGARFKTGNIGVDGNLAGVFTNIGHIYRDPLNIISASLDVQVTFLERYFIGGGFIAGTLADAQWKTKDDPKFIPLDGGGWDQTFTLADNVGYEVYGGLDLWKDCRFVVGFNQNKGIAMNYNIENKMEGQVKYQLADSDTPGSYETGGLFIKMVLSW